MSNKSLGNSFERELADKLAEKGFWVHLLQQSHAGQPADIIACIGDVPFLIDCKVCQNDRFPLSRIEENQRTAMHLWDMRGNSNAYFALKLSDGSIYMHHYLSLTDAEDRGVKSIGQWDISHEGVKFETWAKEVIDDVYNSRLQDYDY